MANLTESIIKIKNNKGLIYRLKSFIFNDLPHRYNMFNCDHCGFKGRKSIKEWQDEDYYYIQLSHANGVPKPLKEFVFNGKWRLRDVNGDIFFKDYDGYGANVTFDLKDNKASGFAHNLWNEFENNTRDKSPISDVEVLSILDKMLNKDYEKSNREYWKPKYFLPMMYHGALYFADKDVKEYFNNLID